MPTRTLIEFAHELTPPACEPFVRDERFSRGQDLIRAHQSLDLLHPEVAAAGLDLGSLIPALLDFSAATHFIKFDPWDATILIKEFPESFLAYQYNPYRDVRNRQATGQKPAATPGKKTDFLAWETFPEAEHYLIWTAASGRRYGILVQPVPIVPNHLIIASLDYAPATGAHWAQAMSADHLADMHELERALGALGYAMGFNDQGAGASVDHFHTQAVPRGFLPLVRAKLADGLADLGVRSGNQGVTLRLLGPGARAEGRRAYPVRGLLLEGPEAALLAPRLAVLARLREAGLRHNGIGWRLPSGAACEAIFPRAQESILNGALKAGYVEMAGMLVIPDKTLYDGLTAPEPGELGIGEAGLSSDAWAAFYKNVESDLFSGR